MIKKLRIKFISAAMLSLFAVLLLIIGAVNVYNYSNIVHSTDNTLSLLEENNGRFPIRQNKPFDEQIMPDNRKPVSPELPFQSRFFSILINEKGETFAVDTDHIAAIDESTAVLYAQKAVSRNKQKGFVNNYRYLIADEGNLRRVIFLDCTKELDTFKSFLFSSCAVSVLGMAAVFALLLVLSGRIIRPVSDSYEKQKRFVTDAGHEIKTPLTIIDADTELLEMEIGENEWLKDIRSQTQRLGKLTNDLIYLSRMQEEQKRLQAIDFPISDVTAETAASFHSRAITEQKEFLAAIEPMLCYKGDENAIRQLISILLDNALKYSDPNSHIHLSLCREAKGIRLSVFNKASFVLKDDLPNFFDRFYRADPSRNSKTGGHGIGLSIAKAVAEAHKGRIEARALNDGVICITVFLPL
ncbi:MAG: HAMP domain-containing histidine kinase [Ruminococcaceae bacterium]|nr:HAMP domain-containing histidine kinase [Oscillospiraceae bacterium]